MSEDSTADMGPFCAAHPQVAPIYYDYVYPISYLIGAILMIPLIYMYTSSYIKRTLAISKTQFYITSFYFNYVHTFS